MTNETGEPVRVMSGEHGTVVVQPGDEFPSWFTTDDPTSGDNETTDGEPSKDE